MATVQTRAQEVDLSELVLEILISKRERLDISDIKQALKLYSIVRFGKSLRYTDQELGIVLNRLIQEWTTFAGIQYRIRMSIREETDLFGVYLGFSAQSRSILLQEKECPSSSLEGIRADGMMDMVT